MRLFKVGSTYQSGGYGFVFPKGSLLVQAFSEGILNLSESDELPKIRVKYFNDTINECFNSENSDPPKMKKSSGEHLKLDVSVGGNTEHNVLIPTSSGSANPETRNESPSNQIHQ
ncbi:hypothetical protein SUGI_0576930 [Cryptomeria japonica]|nr:hypothetical protein SUGI_0576930 [Cryptomeria japonica]